MGGRAIFCWNFARFLGSFALLGLTIAAVVADSERSASTNGGKNLMKVLGKKSRARKGRERSEAFGREESVEIYQAAFFVSCVNGSLLALRNTDGRTVLAGLHHLPCPLDAHRPKS